MTSGAFKPLLTGDEAVVFASRYAVHEDEPALEAGRRIKAGDCSRVHLQTIYKWKANDRGKSRLDRNSDAQIEDALWLAVLAKEPRSGVAVLMGLYGVNTPVASAIATVIYPSRYTIIDFRALQALGSSDPDRSIPFYLEYLRFCTGLADEWGMSLRSLDRALWQWSAARTGRATCPLD